MQSENNIVRYVDEQSYVSLIVINSTEMVSNAQQIHDSKAVVTAALGRLLTATSMMGFLLKGQEDTVTVRVDGDGPIGRILAISDSNGNVRGYAQNPNVDIARKYVGKLDVGAAVGKNGYLSVISENGDQKPHTGMTELVTGEIAEDITHYFAKSLQVKAASALGVLANLDGTVKNAGGFLLQLLPFCPDETIDRIEKNILNLKTMTEMLESGMSINDIAAKVLEGFELKLLEEKKVGYDCPCSRYRVEKLLITLGKEALLTLPDENGNTKVLCNFCDKIQDFSLEQLNNLIEKAKG